MGTTLIMGDPNKGITKYSPMAKSQSELAADIADNGRWEEFHQKRHNYEMYDHHKAIRLKLEREYRERFYPPTPPVPE